MEKRVSYKNFDFLRGFRELKGKEGKIVDEEKLRNIYVPEIMAWIFHIWSTVLRKCDILPLLSLLRV